MKASLYLIGLTAMIAAAVLCGGCFTSSIFQKVGMTDDIVTAMAKTYAKDYAKDKGFEQYATDAEIDALIDSTVKALAADTTFQETMASIAAKKASTEKINEMVKKIMDSGAVLPVVK